MKVRATKTKVRSKTVAAAPAVTAPPAMLSNAEIADRLASLAQLLTTQRENPYKIKAYRRAAETIRHLGDSVDEVVRGGGDLTIYAGIGEGISRAITEIVERGTLDRLETLRATVPPEQAELADYPKLNPKRVLPIYKRLGISSVAELKRALEAGELARKVGAHAEHHVRHALVDSHAILLYDADPIVTSIQRFLVDKCRAKRAEVAGEVRRRVEIIEEIGFVVATEDFPALVERFQSYGGRTQCVSSDARHAVFQLSSGVRVRIDHASEENWGAVLWRATGSAIHLEQLEAHVGRRKLARVAATAAEDAVFKQLGLAPIPPELREGHDEIERAAAGTLPRLVTRDDIRGELHAHTTSSDGAHSIERMAAAARERGYDYLGITDHSQSLKIARGVPEEDLRKQLRVIDRLNGRLRNFRILKSAEVDILADGSLDYPDNLLAELDYTICSIHSRFNLGKKEQTERILRAMDHPSFRILGHATGRLLLRRPGYEIDVERVIRHAQENGRFFEINSSPDRLDLSAAHARLAHDAGIKIAVCSDAHSIGELDYLPYGLDQARRAGLDAASILNARPVSELLELFAG
jgi:DNA polymerase (family X)